MKRPYRDVLAWLAGIRPLNNDLPRSELSPLSLAAYDREPRLGAHWEERFARSPNEHFSVRHQRELPQGLRAYFGD